jgi:tetratricopeptide (TPR) repeat protein
MTAGSGGRSSDPVGRLWAAVDAARARMGSPSYRDMAAGSQINFRTLQYWFTRRAVPEWSEKFEKLANYLGGDPRGWIKLHKAARAAAQGVATGSPAVRQEVVRARQLPARTAAFTGRADALAWLDARFPARRGRGREVLVLAIDGPAGVGKTALAVEWAHRVAARLRDGQLYVDLRGYTDGAHPMAPGDALELFLHGLGVPPAQVPPEIHEQVGLYRSKLAGKRMLVVLDNAASTDQVRPLLPGDPGCVVLITSRDTLAGLVADPGAHRHTLPLFSPAEAVALLGRQIGADRAAAEQDAVAELAKWCAYLPLALRITVANLSTQPPDATISSFVARLRTSDRLAALAVPGDEHTAVRAAFELSYVALAHQAQQMFRLLGLVPGPEVSVEAAAALAGIQPDLAAQLLRRLVTAHLVAESATDRFQFHDLLRTYAHRLCQQDAEADRRRAETRLLDYYVHAAAAAVSVSFPHEPNVCPVVAAPAVPIRRPANTNQADKWLEAERPNLVAGAEHAASGGWTDHAVGLSQVLFRDLEVRGLYIDAYAVHSCALRAAVEAGDRAGEGTARANLGGVYYRRGDYAEALEHLQLCLPLAQQSGDLGLQRRAHSVIANICFWRGNYTEAQGHYEHCLRLAREASDRAGEGRALGSLGVVCAQTGQHDRALDYYHQQLTIAHETGDREGEGRVLNDIGMAYAKVGRHECAIEYYQQYLQIAQDLGSRTAESYARANLGLAYGQLGQHNEALGHLDQALTLSRETSDHNAQFEALHGLGQTLLGLDQPAEALQRQEQALALAKLIGHRHDQARAHDGVAHILHHLGSTDSARTHWEQALEIFTDLGTSEAQDVAARLTNAGLSRQGPRHG